MGGPPAQHRARLGSFTFHDPYIRQPEPATRISRRFLYSAVERFFKFVCHGDRQRCTVSLAKGDNKTPLTMDWNVTISQALPWRSVFEVSYVANKSTERVDRRFERQAGRSEQHQPGIVLPAGSEPWNTSSANYLMTQCNELLALQLEYSGCESAATFAPVRTAANYQLTSQTNDYRPLNELSGHVNQIYHGSYANYNSLQASWQKQSGPVTFLSNYTFGKVLGIRDGQTYNGPGNGTVVDPFSIRNNYGPLAYDHTHIFNSTFSWNLPKFIHGHRALEGAINGWQLSGYTTYQSGAAFQPNINGNLNASVCGRLDDAHQRGAGSSG